MTGYVYVRAAALLMGTRDFGPGPIGRDSHRRPGFVRRGRKIFTIGTAAKSVLGSVEVGDRAWGIALSPDGKTLYSANGPSNDVSVVDVATGTVTKKITAGSSPWGVIALAPF